MEKNYYFENLFIFELNKSRIKNIFFFFETKLAQGFACNESQLNFDLVKING